MTVAAIHQHESPTGTHVSPSWTYPTSSPSHPSGLSQSISFWGPASWSNLYWPSVLHSYYIQCLTLFFKLSYPRILPQSPKVRSTSVSSLLPWHSDSTIHWTFPNSIYISIQFLSVSIHSSFWSHQSFQYLFLNLLCKFFSLFYVLTLFVGGKWPCLLLCITIDVHVYTLTVWTW